MALPPVCQNACTGIEQEEIATVQASEAHLHALNAKVQLACGHAFHINCLLIQTIPEQRGWNNVDSCPTCRELREGIFGMNT